MLLIIICNYIFDLQCCLSGLTASTTDAAKVWTLSANDALDDDVELLDSDQLLDDEDLKLPDPSSLKGNYSCGKFDVCFVEYSLNTRNLDIVVTNFFSVWYNRKKKGV